MYSTKWFGRVDLLRHHGMGPSLQPESHILTLSLLALLTCACLIWRHCFWLPNRVTQDMLLQTAVTRGMVYEYEDNLAENKRMELEILHRS